MKYLGSDSFSTAAPPGDEYRARWDAIFANKPATEGAVAPSALPSERQTSPAIAVPSSPDVTIVPHAAFMRLIEAVASLQDSVSNRRASKKEAELFDALAGLGY